MASYEEVAVQTVSDVIRALMRLQLDNETAKDTIERKDKEIASLKALLADAGSPKVPVTPGYEPDQAG